MWHIICSAYHLQAHNRSDYVLPKGDKKMDLKKQIKIVTFTMHLTVAICFFIQYRPGL